MGIFTPVPEAIVTVNELLPDTPPCVAETVVVPEATALASPELSIVATAIFATAQVAVVLMFAVELSL
jgi:hypothetical protein